jgi:hypothetical protein
LLFFFPVLSSNILYFGAPAIVAWAFLGTLEGAEKRQVSRRRIWTEWLMVLTFFTLLYWWVGVYFTESVGEHSGDEGHYLIQSKSMFYDGDLDIKNNFDEPLDGVDPIYMHIGPGSRRGAWYSWHTSGLAILLAPTVPWGIEMRHFLLSLISGLALAGVYLLCQQVGVARRMMPVPLFLLGGSAFWVIYTSRVLPEVFGGTLAVYAMIATLAQKRFPWRSAILAAVVIMLLPWAHTRFVPLALTAFGCYGLQGLLGDEIWSRKIIRLSVFSVLSIAGLAFFQACQYYMFKGGSPFSESVLTLLFSDPAGMWHILASNRGILQAFPVFAAVLPAVVYLAVRRSSQPFAAFSLLYFLSVFMTSCSTVWFTGGSCVPGRFILVTLPLLIVVLALVFPRSGTGFRAIVWYAGWLSLFMIIIELLVLPDLGKSFTNVMIVDVAHPLLRGLARISYNPYHGARLMPGIAIYGAATALLLLPKLNRLVQGLIIIFIVVSIFESATFPNVADRRYDPQRVAPILEEKLSDSSLVLAKGDMREPLVLTDFSDRFVVKDRLSMDSITTLDLGERTKERAISLPHVAVNDWGGRDYRWATLTTPFRAGHGSRVFVLDAELRGDVSAELIIREGAHNRVVRNYKPGERIKDALPFKAEDAGDVYLLVRLYGGGGEFFCHRLGYSVYSENLLRKANIVLSLP